MTSSYCRGTRQTRKGRRSFEDQIYHVVARAAARQPALADLYVARCIVRAMLRQHQSGRAETLAFVIMPDHLHWLMQLSRGVDLSSVVRELKSESARTINRLRGTTGSLWQRGFFDRAIRREEDIIDVARYVVANPLRARLVNSLKEYPHWHAKWV